MLGEKVTLGTLSATVGRQPERINPLLFACAKTVSEGHLFQPRSLLVERKQIPQIVVIVGTWRKPMAPLEITRLPWAQGVGRSNRPARPIFPTRCGHFHQVAERQCSQVCSCVDPQNSTACGQIGNQAGSDSLIGVQEVTSQISAGRPNCSIVYERS